MIPCQVTPTATQKEGPMPTRKKTESAPAPDQEPNPTPAPESEAKPSEPEPVKLKLAPGQIIFNVTGNFTSLAHAGQVYPVTNGQITLPAAERWYDDLLDAGLLALPK